MSRKTVLLALAIALFSLPFIAEAASYCSGTPSQSYSCSGFVDPECTNHGCSLVYFSGRTLCSGTLECSRQLEKSACEQIGCDWEAPEGTTEAIKDLKYCMDHPARSSCGTDNGYALLSYGWDNWNGANVYHSASKKTDAVKLSSGTEVVTDAYYCMAYSSSSGSKCSVDRLKNLGLLVGDGWADAGGGWNSKTMQEHRLFVKKQNYQYGMSIVTDAKFCTSWVDGGHPSCLNNANYAGMTIAGIAGKPTLPVTIGGDGTVSGIEYAFYIKKESPSVCKIDKTDIITSSCSDPGNNVCTSGEEIKLRPYYSSQCSSDSEIRVTGIIGACTVTMSSKVAGSGISRSWKIPQDFPDECKGKTVPFNFAQLFLDDQPASNFVEPTNNAITFPSDMGGPSIIIDTFPPQPGIDDNPSRIIFKAIATDESKVKSLEIIINDTAQFPETLPNDMRRTCSSASGANRLECAYSSPKKMTYDYPIDVKAVAYDTLGNRNEAVKQFQISTGWNLETYASEVRSTVSGDSYPPKSGPPYYLDGASVTIDVAAKSLPDGTQVKGLDCRFDSSDAGYDSAGKECVETDEMGSTGSSCYAPYDSGYCTTLSDGRKKCSVHVSCARKTSDYTIYKQTGESNLDIAFVIGADTDPPVPIIISPTDGQIIISLSSIPLKVATDEPAVCKWSLENKGYDSMPDANIISATASREHSKSLEWDDIKPASGSEQTVYVSCRDKLGNAMGSSVGRKFSASPLRIRLAASPASIEANGKQYSTITAGVVDSTGKAAPGTYAINFAVSKRPSTAAASLVDSEGNTASKCDIAPEDGTASCSLRLKAESPKAGTATVTASSGDERTTIDVPFAEKKPLKVALAAEPPSAAADKKIIIRASVLANTGELDTSSRLINFAADQNNRDKVSLSFDSCITSAGYCSIEVETAEDSDVSATITGSSASETEIISSGTAAIKFRKPACGDGLCELPYESGSCQRDCGSASSISMSYAQYPPSDSYGLKFSSVLSADDIAVSRNYYVCKEGTSAADCASSAAGINEKAICSSSYDASKAFSSSGYDCVATCSEGETGFYYPLILKTSAGSTMKFRGEAQRFECPSIAGSPDLAEWAVKFNTLKDLISSLESLRASALAGTTITDRERTLYERYAINLQEAKAIVEGHISFLNSVMEQPSARKIALANQESESTYSYVKQVLDIGYSVPEIVIKSVTAPEFITDSGSKYAKTGSELSLSIDVKNNGNTRKGIVSCEFTSPSGAKDAISSTCKDIFGPKNTIFGMKKAVSEIGEWSMACNVSTGSSDCSSLVERDKKQYTFNVVSPSISIVINSPRQSEAVYGAYKINATAIGAFNNLVRASIGKDAACAGAAFAEMANVPAPDGKPTNYYVATFDTASVTQNTGDGEYYVCVSAESRSMTDEAGNPVKASKSVKVSVDNYRFEWPSLLTGSQAAEQPMIYEAVMSNTGGLADRYRINIASNDKGWTATASPESIGVTSGSSERVAITVNVPQGIGSSTTTVTATSETSGEAKTLKIITHTDSLNNPPGISDLKVQPNPSEFGKSVKFSAKIDDADSDAVTAEACRDKDCAGKYCEIMTLSGGLYSCTYTVDRSKDAPGTNEFFVHAKDARNPRGEATAGSTFQISSSADSPTVEVSPASQAGDAGATLAYTVSVFNPSSSPQTFGISVREPTSSITDVTVSKSVTVNAKSAKDGQLQLKSKTMAEAGSYRFTVEVSKDNMIGTGAGEYIVTAPNSPALEISPVYASLQPGRPFNYTATVANRDTQKRLVSLAAKVPSGWTAKFRDGTVTVTSIELEAQASRELKLEIAAPQSAAKGVYEINVTASFANSVTRKPIQHEVQEMILPGKFIMTASPAGMSAPAGENATYTINITNVDADYGMPQTTITLAASGPDNWTVALSKSSVTLSPGNSTSVLLNVTSAFRAPIGDYAINVTGKSPSTNNSLLVNHSIGTSGYLSINSISITPNTTVGGLAFVALDVSNIGNIKLWGYDVCTVRSPSNVSMQLNKSACVEFGINRTGMITTSFTPNEAGIWNVTNCSLYASFSSACSTVLQGSVAGGTVNVTIPPDYDKPTTSILCNGAGCLASYTENVGVTLACTDNTTACNSTRYCVDRQNSCTPATLYNRSVSIPLSGTSYVRYYSKDVAGNTEDVKSTRISIFNYVCGDNVCEPGESCAGDCVSAFSSVSSEETERGAKFSAALEPSLPAARFVACNATSSYSSCKSDYEAGRCGPGGKCLCGWFSFEPGCEARCGDATEEYYVLGYQSVGQQKTIVSEIKSYTCPTLNIGTLMNYVKMFELYSSTVKDQLKAGTLQDSYRQVLEEVKLLADSQKEYLVDIMKDLTATKSAEAIEKSEDVESEIKSLLTSVDGFSRIINITGIDAGTSVVKGRNVSVTITSREDVWRYGLATCQFTKPSGTQTETKTGCVRLPPGSSIKTNTNVVLDATGNWTFRSCKLSIAASDDCDPSILYGTYDNQRQFSVRDPEPLSMKASIQYSNVVLGRKAAVTMEINNTEDMARNAITSCTFAKPDGTKVTNSSYCAVVLPYAKVTVLLSVIADSIGSWSVESCVLKESANSTCSQAWESDSKAGVGSFSVGAEKIMIIAGAATASQQVSVGGTQTINAVAKNTGNGTVRAYVNCTLTDPDGAGRYAASSEKDVAAGVNSDFTVSTTIDREGTWTLESCSAIRMAAGAVFKDDEKAVSSVFDAVDVQCTSDSDCAGSTSSCSCVSSKCTPCGYGYVCRSSACVADRTECLGTSESCYSSGTACVKCPESSACSGGQCVPVNNEPVPEVPMFTIIVVLLAVLTPVIVFLVYRMAISRSR